MLPFLLADHTTSDRNGSLYFDDDDDDNDDDDDANSNLPASERVTGRFEFSVR